MLACEHLQIQNLVHRDIKDENIVVDENYKIKLIDLGSSASIPSEASGYFTNFRGTHMPPEIVRGNAYKGPQAEVWALGCLLYTIIFGENPFPDKKKILAFNGHFFGYPWLIPKGMISPDNSF